MADSRYMHKDECKFDTKLQEKAKRAKQMSVKTLNRNRAKGRLNKLNGFFFRGAKSPIRNSNSNFNDIQIQIQRAQSHRYQCVLFLKIPLKTEVKNTFMTLI